MRSNPRQFPRSSASIRDCLFADEHCRPGAQLPNALNVVQLLSNADDRGNSRGWARTAGTDQCAILSTVAIDSSHVEKQILRGACPRGSASDRRAQDDPNQNTQGMSAQLALR